MTPPRLGSCAGVEITVVISTELTTAYMKKVAVQV